MGSFEILYDETLLADGLSSTPASSRKAPTKRSTSFTWR
jgi:hypothetical protein